MKKKFTVLIAAAMMLLTMASTVWAQAPAGTTLWADDFSYWEAGDVPNVTVNDNTTGVTVYGSGSVTYSVTDGGTTTKIYAESIAGGTSPELLISKGGGTFTIANIPTGDATELTLTYKTNNNNNAVSTTTSGVTVTASGSKASTKTYTITTGGASTITLVVTNSASANTRVDDFNLVVAGGDPTPTTYTVTFDAGDGTFIGNDDFPNTSNTVEAGTYTLPSATPATGFEFDGWLATGNTTLANGSYTVSGNVAFTASYSEIGGGDVTTLTYDFSTTDNFLTSYPGNTHPGTGSNNSLETFYYTNGDAFTASGTNRYFNSGYFMLGKSGATLQLPVFDFDVEKIVITGRTGASGAVVQNIYVGNDAVSSPTTGATGTNTYVIGDGYQAAGTVYTLKVTSAHNTQITEIKVYEKEGGSTAVAVPTFDPASGTEFGNEGLTVTISQANGEEIHYTLDGTDPTINSTLYTQAITLTTTTTIKAIAYDGTNTSSVVTATYTYIDPNAPGTEGNPYTVAQAREAIDAGTGTQGVYATGIISQVDSYNATYHSITYWISDDGTTTDQLEVYSGRGLNDTDFSSVNDVVVGATVVVYGNLKKYNNTIYEFDKNNYLTSYTAPDVTVEAPTFSPIAGTYTEAQAVTISSETSGVVIYYTLDGTDPTMNSDMYENPLAVSTTTTIKAIAVDGNDNISTVATATYHFCSADDPYTVTEALAFLEYPANSIYVEGIVSTAPTQSPTNNGELTYYISVDGEANNQLEVYKGLGLEQAAFGAQDDIQVGDIVTVYGNVVIYGTSNPIKEFAQGNYLVSFERPQPILEDFDLTVEPFENLELITFVDEEMVMEGDGTIQVTAGAQVMLSIVADEGYVIETLMVNGVNHASDIESDFTYTFTMPGENVTISATAVEPVAPSGGDYVRITSLDQLTDGSIVIIAARHDSDNADSYFAMKNTLSNGKATGVQFDSETSGGNEIIPAGIAEAQEDYYWIVNVTEDGYTFTNASGNKIGYASGTNFNLTGNNPDWTIASGTAGDNAMVPGYTGFVITHGTTTTRAFAFNGSVFGAYALTNNNASGYNFFLDFFVQSDETPVTETYTIEIEGYGNSAGGYYLIASPVTVDPADVEGMILTGDDAVNYDLYYFDQSHVGAEWRNYKQAVFDLVPGKGYLYAHKTGVTLTLTGVPYSGDGVIRLDYDENATLKGVNLVGNPFSSAASITKPFYVMKSTGDGFIAGEGQVKAMQGVIVYASTDQEEITFTPGSGTKKSGITIDLIQAIEGRDNSVIDRVIVHFDGSENLPKYQLNPNSTKVYVPQDGNDYAVVNVESANEIPVNFKASTNGTYSFNVALEDLELDALYLVDNLTGETIDLLANPNYSFEAATTDDINRFRLTFSATGVNEDNIEAAFAFINGDGNIVINGMDDNSTVQLIDVTGRVIVSKDAMQGISTTGMNPGVYVLRLVQNGVVRNQKLVIK